MRTVIGLLAAATVLTSACGTESPRGSGSPGSSRPAAVSSPSDGELDCAYDQRQVLVADFDTDPDGGYETIRVALKRHLEHQSNGDKWPSADDFERVDPARKGDDIPFEYVRDGRLLATLWVHDLGRSWLVTGHSVCKEIFAS